MAIDAGLRNGAIGINCLKETNFAATYDAIMRLRWILLGDSGQQDAELYAEAAQEFGDRIAAIYIRDVDPGIDGPLDAGVDAWIGKIAGTKVPMVRVKDSVAIAKHAAGLGLMDPAAIPAIITEVGKDAARPTLGEAAVEEAVEQAKPK